MAAQGFERELAVPAGTERCWEVLTDVALLASWIDIVHDVEELAPLEKYGAVLQDKIGPFKLRALLDITVDVVEQGGHVRIEASGQDRQVGSQISVTGELKLGQAAGGGTVIAVNGGYEVSGRVATLGGGVIRKKADKIIEQFFANAAKSLAA